MKRCKVGLLFFVTAWLITGLVWTQTADDKKNQAYVDLMRRDIRNQKQSIVDEAMALDAAQKSQFWAIYDGYQTALNPIWDQRIANIKKYADSVNNITDEIADQLAVKMIDLEGQRTALKKKYYALYKEKMGALVAARFLQVETILGSFIDLQIAAEVPIIQ